VEDGAAADAGDTSDDIGDCSMGHEAVRLAEKRSAEKGSSYICGPIGTKCTTSCFPCLNASIVAVVFLDYGGGGFLSQLRMAMRVNPQSSSMRSFSFCSGGAQPKSVS